MRKIILLLCLFSLLFFSACGGKGGSASVDNGSGTNSAPTITTQPAPISVVTGQAATFRVAVTGTVPLTWQWSKNGTAISGATDSTYTTPATTAADNGATFSVKVSNIVGSITSNTVALTVRNSGSVAGIIPVGMPGHLAVGLYEHDATWMANSKTGSTKIPWDARYKYLVMSDPDNGWVNNWGNSPADGSWAREYMDECDSQGFMPVLEFYELLGHIGYTADGFYAATTYKDWMHKYFEHFKLLMQRAKEFDKPVLVLIEADGFAYLQNQSTIPRPPYPAGYSAIKDSGMPELQILGNTVQDWGLAFLAIRKAVGADKVILGIHIATWGGNVDIMTQLDYDVQNKFNTDYAFLRGFGLDPNPTGQTYDVLVGDPLDRDADFYRLVGNPDKMNVWWDADNNASINTMSFNRYAEWLKLWNRASKKRWVLWQIPLGNSNHLNVPNTDGPREGYKDNRAEYFFDFDMGGAHQKKFVDAGVIALLFGRGQESFNNPPLAKDMAQSNYTNDYYTDGELYMKSRAGKFLINGTMTTLPR